jgi:CTP-dependent riboflavin kinase
MRQLARIKEELQPLPSQKIDSIELEEYLYNILKFIHDQNQHNVLVSYRKISQEFSISKVTTAKRLNILRERELVLIKKHGKIKSIHISEKGKTLLHKRKII